VQFTGGGKVLVDPWLVGTLSFGAQTWLLESSKYLPPSVEDVLKGVDAILLSQSLDDHMHLPTLKVLPKDIAIIAQPDAAKVVTGLGFTDVRALDHGQQVCTLKAAFAV
jgi:L-ascorbate metabolism protein UlaG (beta-lactamase superfamily)